MYMSLESYIVKVAHQIGFHMVSSLTHSQSNIIMRESVATSMSPLVISDRFGCLRIIHQPHHPPRVASLCSIWLLLGISQSSRIYLRLLLSLSTFNPPSSLHYFPNLTNVRNEEASIKLSSYRSPFTPSSNKIIIMPFSDVYVPLAGASAAKTYKYIPRDLAGVPVFF